MTRMRLRTASRKLAAWEQGTAQPTLKQIEKFASATHTSMQVSKEGRKDWQAQSGLATAQETTRDSGVWPGARRLYPKKTHRWIEGVMGKKKSLGFWGQGD